MKKIDFLVVGILLITSFCAAQTRQEIVKFTELLFYNENERTAFMELTEQKEKVDEFKLLYNTFDKDKISDRAAASKKWNAA